MAPVGGGLTAWVELTTVGKLLQRPRHSDLIQEFQEELRVRPFEYKMVETGVIRLISFFFLAVARTGNEVGGKGKTPQFLSHNEPIHAGETQFTHHGVRLEPLCRFQTFFSGVSDFNRITV